MTFGTEKLECLAARRGKNADTITRFDKIRERDGRTHRHTDGRTPHDGTGRALA